MIIEHTREEREARLFPASIHVFQVPQTARELREEALYTVAGHSGTTLVKSAELRVVLQTLDVGAELKEHVAPGPITVQVIEGEIRFEAEGEIFYLKAGDLLALPAGVPHRVEGVKESAFLLTIAPTASARRGDGG